MSVAKGWEAIIRFPVQTLTKERMIDSNGKEATGDGAKTVFWSRSFPIVDAAGNPTDDETLVTLYVNGTAQASTAFTLTGSLGKIVFATAPAAGSIITLTYKYAKTVGYAQTADISHNPNLEAIMQIGGRGPVEIKEGKTEITVSIERCWLDRDLLGKVSAIGALPEFQIDILPKGVGAGNPIISAVGKFNGWSMSVGVDAIVLESVEFTGRTVSVGTQ